LQLLLTLVLLLLFITTTTALPSLRKQNAAAAATAAAAAATTTAVDANADMRRHQRTLQLHSYEQCSGSVFDRGGVSPLLLLPGSTVPGTFCRTARGTFCRKFSGESLSGSSSFPGGWHSALLLAALLSAVVAAEELQAKLLPESVRARLRGGSAALLLLLSLLVASLLLLVLAAALSAWCVSCALTRCKCALCRAFKLSVVAHSTCIASQIAGSGGDALAELVAVLGAVVAAAVAAVVVSLTAVVAAGCHSVGNENPSVAAAAACVPSGCGMSPDST
jgi:hypothetical protein